MPDLFAEAKQAEAEFFDQVVDIKTGKSTTRIPLEADMRRATRVDPQGAKDVRIDPALTKILDRGWRELFIGHLAHRPGGRVLDICCGPGWLALELGRRGQRVDAYDLSPNALNLARRMLAENPYREGFGEVNYFLQDVTQVELGEETYDAVSGWSAFHHLPNLREFMNKVWRALKPGGIVATMDDMPPGKLEKALEYSAKFLLPIYTLTYAQKTAIAARRLLGRAPFPEEICSPMEAGKATSVFEIGDIWRSEYELLVEARKNAFIVTPALMLSGPDWFRYPTVRLLVELDKVACRTGMVHGYERIMIAQKPL